MGSLGEVGIKESFPSSVDPIKIELDRLDNNLRDKERELAAAYTEIKALKVTQHLKDKAVLELSNELKKLELKLRSSEKNLELKNLELKRALDEKKEALAGQFAAEATLRRIHAAQNDDESLPMEGIIAPLEADSKQYRSELARLRENYRALERLTKSKEMALLEADKLIRSTLEKAMMVESVQNQNLELKRQIEICQEENRILEKMHRQKVQEVEKLSQTVHELEESLLAGGAAANAVRNYQRQVSKLNVEKKDLERDLARAKISANRVATVVANEWKDDGDKVMPVKQWLEERRFFQIQRLRNKAATAERTAKAEAQLKDKLRLRLKTLEEGFKSPSNLLIKQNESSTPASGLSQSNAGPTKLSSSRPTASIDTNEISTVSITRTEYPAQSSGVSNHISEPKKRSSSQPRDSFSTQKISVLQQPNSSPRCPYSPISTKNTVTIKSPTGDSIARKNLWAPRSKFLDEDSKENVKAKTQLSTNNEKSIPRELCVSVDETRNVEPSPVDPKIKSMPEDKNEDMVSGVLYDRLQKEVISSRKLHEEKNELLSSKDGEIKMLHKKIDTLAKAMEIELKKARKEAAAREKEAVAQSHPDENKQKPRSTSTPRRGPKRVEHLTNARS